tara:strand:- start:1262 stop:2110 length:849 start_codon:yes stop_codon:yes gene_type:complete
METKVKPKLDPYADIRKVPLVGTDGTSSSAFGIQTDTGKKGKSKWQEVGVVRDDYLLVSNQQVFDMANHITQESPLKWEVKKEFYNGKSFGLYYTATDQTRTIDSEDGIKKGDAVALGLHFLNSYDGSKALTAGLHLERLICANGMITNHGLSSVRILHDKSNAKWEEDVEKILGLIDSSDEQVSSMMSAFSEMDRSILDEGMLRHIANNVIPGIADGTFGKIYRKFSEDNKGNSATVWDWYNACTDVLWKNPNQTKADFSNNAYVTDRMIEFTNKELVEVA